MNAKKIKRKLSNKLSRLTYEINNINLQIQNWTIKQQMKFNGMEVIKEEKSLYSKFITYIQLAIYLIILFTLYFNVGWIVGTIWLIIGSPILTFIFKYVYRLRIRVEDKRA